MEKVAVYDDLKSNNKRQIKSKYKLKNDEIMYFNSKEKFALNKLANEVMNGTLDKVYINRIGDISRIPLLIYKFLNICYENNCKVVDSFGIVLNSKENMPFIRKKFEAQSIYLENINNQIKKSQFISQIKLTRKVSYKECEKMWNEYIIDYNEENLKNNLVINHIKEHEYEIFLFSKGKRLANIIYSANKKINIDEIKALIYENFSFYMNLPLLSETSPLLQKLYYLIKDSSKETIKISNEEWDKKYLKRFNEEYNNLYDEINGSYLENSINFPNEPIYDLEGYEIPKDKSEDKIIINKSLLLYINNDVDYDLSKDNNVINDLEK